MGNIQPFEITDNDLTTLAQAGVIPHGTPAAILRVFAVASQQHGLSPFKKEIYLTSYNTKDGIKYATIVGIDGLRAKAARSGYHAGRDDCKFDLQPDGAYKTAAQIKAADTKPVSATVTVYKLVAGQRCAFTKTVLFAEYCPANVSNKWATMPCNQIEKCAEAAALRMAFADETAGLHIEEEKAAFEDSTIQAAQSKPELSVDVDALKALISGCKTIDQLNALYKKSSLYAAYASLFTEQKELILDELQIAGKV